MTKRSTTARGYGTSHQRLRARLARDVAAGRAVCARCGQPIVPGSAWDLGHDDTDPSKKTYRGPEHERCNRSAGARKGNRLRRAGQAVADVTGLRW